MAEAEFHDALAANKYWLEAAAMQAKVGPIQDTRIDKAQLYRDKLVQTCLLLGNLVQQREIEAFTVPPEQEPTDELFGWESLLDDQALQVAEDTERRKELITQVDEKVASAELQIDLLSGNAGERKHDSHVQQILDEVLDSWPISELVITPKDLIIIHGALVANERGISNQLRAAVERRLRNFVDETGGNLTKEQAHGLLVMATTESASKSALQAHGLGYSMTRIGESQDIRGVVRHMNALIRGVIDMHNTPEQREAVSILNFDTPLAGKYSSYASRLYTAKLAGFAYGDDLVDYIHSEFAMHDLRLLYRIDSRALGAPPQERAPYEEAIAYDNFKRQVAGLRELVSEQYGADKVAAFADILKDFYTHSQAVSDLPLQQFEALINAELDTDIQSLSGLGVRKWEAVVEGTVQRARSKYSEVFGDEIEQIIAMLYKLASPEGSEVMRELRRVSTTRGYYSDMATGIAARLEKTQGDPVTKAIFLSFLEGISGEAVSSKTTEHIIGDMFVTIIRDPVGANIPSEALLLAAAESWVPTLDLQAQQHGALAPNWTEMRDGYVLSARQATETDRLGSNPVDKLAPLRGKLMPPLAQLDTRVIAKLRQDVATDTVRTLTRFVSKRGFETSLAGAGLPVTIAFKQHSVVNTAILCEVRWNGVHVTMLFDDNYKVHYDKRVIRQPAIAEEVAYVAASVLRQYACSPAVETTDGSLDERSGSKIIQRIAHFAFLPRPQKSRDEAAQNLLADRGLSLAAESARRKLSIESKGRNSTYRQASVQDANAKRLVMTTDYQRMLASCAQAVLAMRPKRLRVTPFTRYR